MAFADVRGGRRVALVTGAAGGIGMAICQRLLDAGVDVVACDVKRVRIEPSSAQSAHASVLTSRIFDLKEETPTRETFDWVAAEYGRLDVLVNNAAIWFGEAFVDSTDDHWREVLEVNLLAPVRLSRLAVPLLAKSACPRIVNVASKNALLGERGWSSYDVSKAALVALTRSLGYELAHLGILVNAVAPGHIRTDGHMDSLGSVGKRHELARRIPLGRMGEPIEVARAVAFLASEECSFATGATLLMDGGQLAAEEYPG